MKRLLQDLMGSARRSAERWVLECGTCSRAVPALEHGVFRAWARSRGKRVLVRCSGCGHLRWARLVEDPERARELRSASRSPEP